MAKRRVGASTKTIPSTLRRNVRETLGSVRMLGLMQDWPLLCHRIIEHAAAIHGNQEVVTRSVEGPVVRTTYKQIRERLRASEDPGQV